MLSEVYFKLWGLQVPQIALFSDFTPLWVFSMALLLHDVLWCIFYELFLTNVTTTSFSDNSLIFSSIHEWWEDLTRREKIQANWPFEYWLLVWELHKIIKAKMFWWGSQHQCGSQITFGITYISEKLEVLFFGTHFTKVIRLRKDTKIGKNKLQMYSIYSSHHTMLSSLLCFFHMSSLRWYKHKTFSPKRFHTWWSQYKFCPFFFGTLFFQLEKSWLGKKYTHYRL